MPAGLQAHEPPFLSAVSLNLPDLSFFGLSPFVRMELESFVVSHPFLLNITDETQQTFHQDQP